MTANSLDRLFVTFHGVGDPAIDIPEAEKPYWCAQGTFLNILDSIVEIEAASRTRIALTFDDGNLSDVKIAMPALAKRGLKGQFFVCAGRIGTPGYLDGPAMSEMLAAGMEIGSHGWSHINWRLADDAAMTREIEDAQDRLANVTGRPIDTVAIPFGNYDRRVLGKLKAWKTIYTSDNYRAGQPGRIVPRCSYAKNWDDETLLRIAGEPYTGMRRLQHRFKHLVKRMR